MPLAKHPASEADSGFEEHKAAIARLYLTEGRTLEDVKEIMAARHQFTASNKMYKSRFKKWGWRKNIRFDQPLVLLNSDAAAGPHATAKSRALHVSLIPARGDASSSSTTPVAVVEKKQDVARASNDLVVDRDRLETYLRRRERRDRQRLGNLVHAPVTVRLPDRFLASQTVLVNVKEYLVRRYTGQLATAQALDTLWTKHISKALFSWDRFTYAVTEALETPDGFQDAMVLLRRAPQELAMMLHSQPVITTSDLCVFIIYLTRPRAYRDAHERRQFYKVVRALFKVAASLFDWPADHPMLKIFQGFYKADDEDIHYLATQGWKVGSSTMDTFLDYLGPTNNSASVADIPSTEERVQPEIICVLDETVRRARAGYLTTRPWCLNSMYHCVEELRSPATATTPSAVEAGHTGDTGAPRAPEPEPEPEPVPARRPNHAAPASSLDWRAVADETVANTCRALNSYKPSGGTKIIAMKALFDAHSAYGAHDLVQRRLAEAFGRNCVAAVCEEFGARDPMVERYLAELEDVLLAWGEPAKARDVARWRAELLGLGLGVGGERESSAETDEVGCSER